MAIPFSSALAAYGRTQDLTKGLGGVAQQPKPASNTPDFGELVTQSIQNVVETGKKSDQLSIDMVNGQGNIVDVVTAISQTELAVESLVTVRDRVISAYEEIMRMPI
jgi:flagellar hook-basal body complex protein FliE